MEEVTVKNVSEIADAVFKALVNAEVPVNQVKKEFGYAIDTVDLPADDKTLENKLNGRAKDGCELIFVVEISSTKLRFIYKTPSLPSD